MAKSVFRRATKTVLIAVNAIISILFLTACLTPYLNPTNWWVIGFAGLGVPYLVLVLIFFIIFWLMMKPWIALLPLLTLAYPDEKSLPAPQNKRSQVRENAQEKLFPEARNFR